METLASDIDLEEIDLDPETEEEAMYRDHIKYVSKFSAIHARFWNEYNTLRQTTNRR